MKNRIAVFWFRRDLRLEDNTGLHYALSSGVLVLPIFIFDTNILSRLESKSDRRVDYIHQALNAIHNSLTTYGAVLKTFSGKPLDVFKKLDEDYDIQAVYCNRDYEPSAIERDTVIFDYFKSKEIPFKAYKDQVIFDKNDILKTGGKPYTVYTPYAKKWRETLCSQHYKAHDLDMRHFFQQEPYPIHTLEELGFRKTDMVYKTPELDPVIIDNYDHYRDYPAMEGTTKLGIALRFGTISIRSCVAFALKHNQVWLSELIWREFYMQILYHFPRAAAHSFKEQYDRIQWRNDEQEFKRWCEGKTGFPMVDAGMRQLNETGFMHNRLRMITASFVCKHLLIDWRWGESYFAAKLNDYDMASNNGSWQWASGSGCDAVPYFRIFNPSAQLEKFDKDLKYVRRWIPELDTAAYPQTVVEHSFARNRALHVYKSALMNGML